MATGFPVNKQTAVGLLMFLVFLWTLSTFIQTPPNTPAHITHQQPIQPAQPVQPVEPVPPVRQPDSGLNKPVSVPGTAVPDKSKPPPDVSRPNSSPQFTLPPWYEEDEDKTSSKDKDKAKSKDKTQSKDKSNGKANGKTETNSAAAQASHPANYASDAVDSKTNPKATASTFKERPLILYAFAESAPALENLRFFIKQGLHDAADFVFILNGETEAASLIPDKENIKVVKRPNTCFDLGAYGEVLRKDNLYKQYRRFIALNASIRGPFLPHWAKSCWSDMYLDRVNEQVKLVGMTGNCWPRFHVQSMIWATDDVGLDLLLNPPPGSSINDDFGTVDDPVGLAGCYDGWNHAVHAEIGATGILLKQGFQVDLMMSAFHKSKNYIDECDTSQNGDVLWNGKYFGTNVHPFETIFIKANRDIDPTLIEHLTTWQQASGFDSYSLCGGKS